jgi:aminoacylase
MEFVNGHFDNTLTAIDESNIWWTVFSDACKGMNVDYETEIFPGKISFSKLGPLTFY